VPLYKVSGVIGDDSIVYVIDEDSKIIEKYESVVAGAYEIDRLSSGDKIIVAVKASGESSAYGSVTAIEGEGDTNSTGNDGSITIDTADTVVNDYTNVASIAGVNSLTVGDSSPYSVGDEVLIIQMQDADALVGNWETRRISNVSSPTLTFTEDIVNTYSIADDDVVQAVRIPNYNIVGVESDASIVCPAWDGSTGGIIFFRARNEVTISGTIGAINKGFRGGAGRGGNTAQYGWRGESTQPVSFGAYAGSANMALGGGGGGWCGTAGTAWPAGGAGGGHATVGQAGRKAGSPYYSGANGVGGDAYGVVNLDKIYFGSAGGNSYSSFGGNGGGIIIISALVINLTGTINANGQTSWEYGGSGAGGTVWLQSTILNMGTNLVSATGGAITGYGGAGGTGRIRLDYTTLTGSTANPTPGYTGSY